MQVPIQLNIEEQERSTEAKMKNTGMTRYDNEFNNNTNYRENF